MTTRDFIGYLVTIQFPRLLMVCCLTDELLPATADFACGLASKIVLSWFCHAT